MSPLLTSVHLCWIADSSLKSMRSPSGTLHRFRHCSTRHTKSRGAGHVRVALGIRPPVSSVSLPNQHVVMLMLAESITLDLLLHALSPLPPIPSSLGSSGPSNVCLFMGPSPSHRSTAASVILVLLLDGGPWTRWASDLVTL